MLWPMVNCGGCHSIGERCLAAVGINRVRNRIYLGIYHGRSFGSIVLTGRKKRVPTILQYFTHERRRLEPRRCRYERTTRLNIMLERWSTTFGGGGPRTVRRRHPSVPIGDCGPRLESATRLDRKIDFRKWIFLLLFSSLFNLVGHCQRAPRVPHKCSDSAGSSFSYNIISIAG